MEKVAIKFENVTKVYKLYKNDKQKFLGLFFKKVPFKNKVASNNISFEIKKGETVAVLGKNGAGKSTLLKLMTEVTSATQGMIHINGQVSALLELSTGFELDFTGRENIYLKGSLMGMKTEEIQKIEQNVVDFADIGDYMDQPIRTYSSGMKARLGFAICVNIDPEIFIVDEALSVGDDQFKAKCLHKVKEIIKKDDITFVFVTHSSQTAEQFCSRGIVLDEGTVMFDGEIKEAVAVYKKLIK